MVNLVVLGNLNGMMSSMETHLTKKNGILMCKTVIIVIVSEIIINKIYSEMIMVIILMIEQNIGRLNCYTNSSRNIRLINGTLALTAIYEKTLNKNFSSAWIRSSVNFTYGRIEIRAALPGGKLLSTWIKLVSPNFKYTEGKVRRNQVFIIMVIHYFISICYYAR